MAEFFWRKTRAGVFRIAHANGGWQPWFEDERLMGTYPSPQHALDDLAGGYTDWPSCGDPSELGLPDDIGEWAWHSDAR
ncbi:hypothetical protein [Xanthomonas arboricola]|uniref:hypothetical protein n=1 Tax=Xanthomonas arboricola TaxID=56448 RepID=UPI001618B586|nr:hypothetical protein [Xanthomonas arboricola]MBB3759238.1 hypothetical protein [Xanthomonas arboricola]MCC8671442.1 hypothetical protein [Xanthomonas arboricola]